VNHEHVGPLDRACEGCYIEAQALIEKEDDEARRAWRWILLVYIVSMIALVLVLVFRFRR